MTAKLMDEHVHTACMTLTFATANRGHLARLPPEEIDAELARSPDRERAEIKRQVVRHGLDAPMIGDALRQHAKLIDLVDAAMRNGPFIAGGSYSLADAGATPYIWRLDKLKLARLWEHRPAVAGCYERIRQRPSFKTAVEEWVTPADLERYSREPDPWPKVRQILAA
jgi:glutathione S-transferase